MSYSHSRQADLNVTHSSPLSTLLSVLFFFFHPPLKPRCQGRVMGFVGGGSNIAITTALPPSSFMYWILNIIEFMEFIYPIFYACLRLQFLDVKTKPGLRHPIPAVCRILCSNVRGLAGNLRNQTVASSQYDILFCSETLVSDIHHVSELLVHSFHRPVLLCRGKMPRASGMAAYVRDGYGPFRQPKFECDCCEMQVLGVCGMRQNFYVYSLYFNPDLDDRIFDCLLASMTAVQAEDVRASFLFVCDLNGHHQEWLGSMTTTRHGVAAFDFATVSSCEQLVASSTHARGATLDLLMTDVPD